MVQLLIDHIVSDPEHRGGKPRIKGTGITVQNVVEDIAAGLSPEYIADQFDLTLGQIYAALSYYHDHRQHIDQAIEADRLAQQALLASEAYQKSQEHSRKIKAKLDADNANWSVPIGILDL